jgi:hypothetical protein
MRLADDVGCEITGPARGLVSDWWPFSTFVSAAGIETAT